MNWRRQRINARAYALWENEGRPQGRDVAHWVQAEAETPHRVSFDSNAWEVVFDPNHRVHAPIRAALSDGRLEAFISEAGFRIEAVRRSDRAKYFEQPRMDMRVHGTIERDGQGYIHLSFGPDDKHHPGLPPIQAARLQSAVEAGVRLMRGLSWMGLPSPREILDPCIFVRESDRKAREQVQIDVSASIDARRVGHAAFDAAGGWNIPSGGPLSKKALQNACAEWADGELVQAHIAYRNDILCTDDFGRGAGVSIFDASNRAWLSVDHGVMFMTLDELLALIIQG